MAKKPVEKPAEDDSIGKKLDLADSWLTKFGNIMKKHWGKLLFLLLCYCVYWAFTQPAPVNEEVQAPPTDTVVIETPGETIYEEVPVSAPVNTVSTEEETVSNTVQQNEVHQEDSSQQDSN
jgi:hypothetical protein